jgi:hypothetical protein
MHQRYGRSWWVSMSRKVPKCASTLSPYWLGVNWWGMGANEADVGGYDYAFTTVPSAALAVSEASLGVVRGLLW